MTMASISPFGGEVSPAGSSCRSSRLVLLKFRLMAAANPRKSSALIFFPDETLHIAKEGGQWATRVSTSPVAAARGGGRGHQACGPLAAPLWHFFRPVFFIYSQKIPR